HAAGLVHRDFKPDNVLIARDAGQPGAARDWRVRVMDFGLVRAADDGEGDGEGEGDGGPPGADGRAAERDAARPASGGANPTPLERTLTRTGAIRGTPAYMAPEQHLGRPVDHRTDQFSFCVALYEALYRQSPFGGTIPAERAAAVIQGDVRPPPAGSSVPV